MQSCTGSVCSYRILSSENGQGHRSKVQSSPLLLYLYVVLSHKISDVPLTVVYYESIKRELKTKLIYECRCDERLMCHFVYYESIKRELNKRLIFDSRCDARLKAKSEGCTRLSYTM